MKDFKISINIAGILAILYLPYIALSMPTTFSEKKFQLNFIGSADGKSFFAESDITLNWTDASAFCKNSSMQLASLTSVTQQNLLKNATNPTFIRNYWTGGRDAQTHAQFAWESNEVPLDPSLAGPFGHYASIQTCVYYSAVTGFKHLRSAPCTDKLYILCEIIT